jgi:hypothetical protein
MGVCPRTSARIHGEVACRDRTKVCPGYELGRVLHPRRRAQHAGAKTLLVMRTMELHLIRDKSPRVASNMPSHDPPSEKSEKSC